MPIEPWFVSHSHQCSSLCTRAAAEEEVIYTRKKGVAQMASVLKYEEIGAACALGSPKQVSAKFLKEHSYTLLFLGLNCGVKNKLLSVIKISHFILRTKYN